MSDVEIRRNEIIELLYTYKKYSIDDFAKRFGVSRRTINYDIVYLMDFYEIDTKPGPHGGISLIDRRPNSHTAYSTILQPFRQDMQCGCCDERLYWHPKTNQWFCRKCGMWAKPLQAEEISATIAEKLCWLRQNPEIIHNPEGQANVQSVEVALLDREIWQALTNAEPDVDALVAKILHRAELEYKFCTAGDADPATLLIQKACTEYVPTEGFPETFYKEVVSKVILYRDNHLELKLQNGQIV